MAFVVDTECANSRTFSLPTRYGPTDGKTRPCRFGFSGIAYVDAARAAGHPDVVAPPTFAAVVVEPAVGQLLRSPNTGLDPTRVVHGSQSARYHRHIVAGDELTTDLTITAVTERGAHAIVTTSSIIRDSEGRPVATVTSTLFARGDDV
jgi:acyl dehydratase